MLELAVGIHEDNFIFRFLETHLTTFRKDDYFFVLLFVLLYCFVILSNI